MAAWQSRYSQLRTFVFLEYDITQVLAILKLTKLAAHQSFKELLSDWSKRQLCGELMMRKVLRSAKIKSVQWLIGFHRSLMNSLRRKGPRTEPCCTPKLLETIRREYHKWEPHIICWLSTSKPANVDIRESDGAKFMQGQVIGSRSKSFGKSK
jgi:hypothetical protein